MPGGFRKLAQTLRLRSPTISRSKLCGLIKTISGGKSGEFEITGRTQAEIRDRMVRERAHGKKAPILARTERSQVSWDRAPDEPQVESEPLEKTRVELAIERHPNGSTSVSQMICTRSFGLRR